VQRTHCGGCDSTVNGIETFLDLGSTPLANDLPRTTDQLEQTYPLKLGVCHQCWLVQMMDVVPHETVFGGDYTFYSGTSPGLVRYHERYAATLRRRYLHDLSFVVEIACNDGDLLRHFSTYGHRTLGIDPAEGPVRQARQRGLDVIHDSFTEDSALSISEWHGHADLIIANNVLAHVIDLGDFMRGIHTLLAPEGVAVIEVQYLPDLLLGNQFDHVYHEHRYFFSLSSLARVAETWGLVVVHAETTTQQGGSLRVTLAHEGSTVAVSSTLSSVDKMIVYERLIRHESAYTGVQFRAERIRQRLLDLLDVERRTYRTVAGYGMPAKATTLLNFCGIGHDLVSHIVDTTPAKIGRYVPGVKIPIVGPNMRNEPSTYLVLVWNYLAGIMERERKFREAGGRFIVPIPTPVML
jgi:SAM-dependent methyltransferase